MHDPAPHAEVAEPAAVGVEVLLVALEQGGADGDLGGVVILDVGELQVAGEAVLAGGFEDVTADYRRQDVFLYNASWKFLPQKKTGTYFIDGLRSGEKFPNRYQVLDQLVASRGLVSGSGLTLNLDSVDIFQDSLVATSSGRPRGFSRKSKKGTSDHLPVTAVLEF